LAAHAQQTPINQPGESLLMYASSPSLGRPPMPGQMPGQMPGYMPQGMYSSGSGAAIMPQGMYSSGSPAMAPPARWNGGLGSNPGTPQVPPNALGQDPRFSSQGQFPGRPSGLGQLSAVPQPQLSARAPIMSEAPNGMLQHEASGGIPQQGYPQQGQFGAPAPAARGSELQAEIVRRQAAEARVRDLEALVARLRQRIGTLEGGKRPPGGGGGSGGGSQRSGSKQTSQSIEPVEEREDDGIGLDDPIDRTICEYLERNPDFPVSVQKVAPNYYVFGDRGTVYVTQRGEHIVVRVGGGFKSLQVFMDERALMVTREAAAALAEKTQGVLQ